MDQELSIENKTRHVKGTCLRCGKPWIGLPGGRPRKWCSVACRRAAYEERRAAARGSIAVREVERPKIVDHDITECTKRVRLSPGACRRLLQTLADGDEIVTGSDPRWDPVRGLVVALAERRQAYLRLPHWRR